MPLTVQCPEDSQSIELADLVDSLERDFDPQDQAALAEWGPALARLANNRRFLGDIVIDELKKHCSRQAGSNQYSAQVILLHGTSRKFMIRANFWPAESDSVFTNSGAKSFFYGLPHDHNFDFLTVGYLGPGYWSDYYEYDYGSVLGYPGEQVDLRFVERSRLSPGRVLLYRKHLDVHSQLPPDSLSVSLNILANNPALEFQEQYSFDLQSSTVSGFVNRSGLESLIRLAGTFGGGNGDDLVDHVARHHPSDRMRFAAWRSKAASAPDAEARAAVYEEAAASSSGQLAALALAEAARVRRGMPWLMSGAAPIGAPSP
jgi:hypothetical protein